MNWVAIGSGNGLSFVRRQATNWANGEVLGLEPQEQESVKFESKHTSSFKQVHWELLSA